MIDFEFHSPTSLDEAFGLLDQYGDDARVMSGGTALVLMMKQRLAQPGHVIGLRRIPGLASVASDGNGAVRVGALCTQRQMETDWGPRWSSLPRAVKESSQWKTCSSTISKPTSNPVRF